MLVDGGAEHIRIPVHLLQAAVETQVRHRASVILALLSGRLSRVLQKMSTKA
jgi:hypothetical protein